MASEEHPEGGRLDKTLTTREALSEALSSLRSKTIPLPSSPHRYCVGNTTVTPERPEPWSADVCSHGQ